MFPAGPENESKLERFSALAVPSLLVALAAIAQEPPPAEPIPLDMVERERVRLVILDVVVVDGDGRTVPGLGLDDFELIADGKPVTADTLDVNCPG